MVGKKREECVSTWEKVGKRESFEKVRGIWDSFFFERIPGGGGKYNLLIRVFVVVVGRVLRGNGKV